MGNLTYFVVMRDFGRRGREAIVDPELTRRNVIDRVRSGEYDRIVFIHEITIGEPPCDVTEDIMQAAELEAA